MMTSVQFFISLCLLVLVNGAAVIPFQYPLFKQVLICLTSSTYKIHIIYSTSLHNPLLVVVLLLLLVLYIIDIIFLIVYHFIY